MTGTNGQGLPERRGADGPPERRGADGPPERRGAESVERVAIAGGGIAGLAMALAAGRAGHDVVLLERDPAPQADSPEAAFDTSRSGAPQAHQTHGFLARLTLILRERFPDVLDELLDAGARTLPLTRELGEPRPGDEDLAILVLRRTTLEWVLRRIATREPNVEIRSKVGVAGLTVADAPADSGVPLVDGLRLDDGTTLPADVVAACTGRRGDVPAWLAHAAGVEIPETVHDTRFVYLTRWYRWRDGEQDLVLPARLGLDLVYLKYLAVPCDGGTFSVTLAVPAKDRELRSLLSDTEVFDRVCQMLPGPSDLIAHGATEPLGPVRPMAGLVNRIRRFLDADGQPLVAGFHAVGDAHTCTNPLYGRGCALGFVQATLLADALAAHPGDPIQQAVAYEAASAREVEPWFHAALQWDEASTRRLERGSNGSDASSAADDMMTRILVEGGTDPVIGRAILRMINLLVLPQDLMSDPEFLTAAMPIVTNPDPAPLPTPEGPTREEILAL